MGASASAPAATITAAAVRAWTADDVASRVSGLGAAYVQYEATIKENGVDGEMLLALEPEELKEHVKSGMHLKKLIIELRKLKERERLRYGH